MTRAPITISDYLGTTTKSVGIVPIVIEHGDVAEYNWNCVSIGI